MKKVIIAFTMAALMLFGATACGNNQATSTPSISASSAAGSSAAKPAGELTQASLKTYPVTAESHFKTQDAEGGVTVTCCDSNDDVIVVPKTIGGKTVVKIGVDGICESPCRGIVLPDSVWEIMGGAFCEDKKLEYIDLGKNLDTVDGDIFKDCTELRSVTFPDGVKTIQGLKNIFGGCKKLKEVHIPASAIVADLILNHKDCPDAVIITPSGSEAEDWAKENDVPVKNK